MPISQHSSASWQEGKNLWVKHNDIWKNVTEGYVNNSLSWQRFHTAEETVTLSANASAVDVASLFDSGEWTGAKTKRLIIPQGVTLSGTTSAPALAVSATWNNFLTIENHGIIQGAGGSANGGVGGDALVNDIANDIILENHGTIRSGGGGGGQGGDGGGGVYTTEVYDGSNGHVIFRPNSTPAYFFVWGGNSVGSSGSQLVSGVYRYVTGAQVGINYVFNDPEWGIESYTHLISRYRTDTSYTAGGLHGAGGDGTGSNGGFIDGSTGSSGGTNAGTGGSGGEGGDWGQSGSAGANGSDGNNGTGTAGSAGGLAGYAHKGQFNVTNSGIILGRT